MRTQAVPILSQVLGEGGSTGPEKTVAPLGLGLWEGGGTSWGFWKEGHLPQDLAAGSGC